MGSVMQKASEIKEGIDRSVFDDADKEDNKYKAEEGLSEELIRKISSTKGEPEWMLQHRLKCLKLFYEIPLPTWGPDLSGLDLNKIIYFILPNAKENATNWDDVPKEIKEKFEKLGIPEAEQKYLAGTGAQYEAQGVYHNLKEEWTKKGVIFEDLDDALRKYPDLVKKHFMKCVPPTLHKFAALHGAVWSGGTFLYIPKGVEITFPLQSYFRMNAKRAGQFEHTLIIVEEAAQAHYIEGCSAPQYTEKSLHAGCVEIYVGKHARFRYSSVENWSRNTYNLNTKRAIVQDNGVIEWVGGNMGSGVTMLYPCSILKGHHSTSSHLSVAFAGKDQHQDVGGKVIHIGRNTTSTILSKSISKDGGKNMYRGMIKIHKGATGAKTKVQCDGLLMDSGSTSDTIPAMYIDEDDVTASHEAAVGKLDEDHMFYLMSRGLNEQEAVELLVSGFIEPIIKELPMEYAVELNRLIQLEITGM